MEKQRGSTSCPWPSPGRESWVSKLLLLSLRSHISCYRCKFLMEWERDVLYYGLSYVFLHLYSSSLLTCERLSWNHSTFLGFARIQDSGIFGGKSLPLPPPHPVGCLPSQHCHGEKIYTMEIGKCYSSGLCSPLPPRHLLNIYSTLMSLHFGSTISGG